MHAHLKFIATTYFISPDWSETNVGKLNNI